MNATRYVVLVGDVGHGKSTLFEKLTGLQGQSSQGDFSSTKASMSYYTPCKSLLVCDTPGTNPIYEKLDHNMEIAYALNSHPVSSILIVVKADIGRIDNVMDAIGKYAENFSSLFENIGVCVTHMDKVKWTCLSLKQAIRNQFGIENVVFSDKHVGVQLVWDILSVCGQAKTLSINSNNFLKFFKISNNNIMILRSINEEVGNFKVMKNDFEKAIHQYPPNEQIDLVFEFQAWMGEEIVRAQQRVTAKHNFNFLCGGSFPNDVGHIAYMTNQLKLVLYDIRIRAQSFQSSHGVNDPRKCPHCGEVWAKLEGCDGATTCGNRMSSLDARYTELANFDFYWFQGRLQIQKKGVRKVVQKYGSAKGIGCGRQIIWKDMTPVQLPAELALITSITVEDVRELPEAAKECWDEVFSRKMNALVSSHESKVKDCSNHNFSGRSNVSMSNSDQVNDELKAVLFNKFQVRPKVAPKPMPKPKP